MLTRRWWFFIIVLAAILIIGSLLFLSGCTPGDGSPQATAAEVVIGDGGVGRVTAVGSFNPDRWHTVTVYVFQHEGRTCYVARELYSGYEQGGVGIGISCVP